MNIKDIAALAEIVKQNELTKLEINGENIVIERAAQVVQAAPILNAVQPAVPEQMHTTEPIAEVKEKEGVYVKSPAVGVFYTAPSPNSTQVERSLQSSRCDIPSAEMTSGLAA